METDIELQAQARRITHTNLKLSAFHYDANYNYSIHLSVVIEKIDELCRYCRTFKFKNEAPGMCCAGLKVKLAELHPPPEPLTTLVSGDTSKSKHFLTNIHKYNSYFQMTSFSTTNIMRDDCMLTFKVQGHIYHRAGPLLSLPNTDNKFLQMYFMGNTNEQIEYVIHTIRALDEELSLHYKLYSINTTPNTPNTTN